MREKRVRTAFGERLFKARSHAKLTQPQLAKAAGMAQSTLAELEYIGSGSSKTAQIAKACGVNPQWLAEGVGPMTAGPSKVSAELMDLAVEVEAMPPRQRDWLLMTLREAVKLARETVVEQAIGSAPAVEPSHSAKRTRAA